MNNQNLKYRLLADLLTTLEAEEFSFGVGKHLELQELMAKLPDDVEAENLKTILSPLFAKSKQDQAAFYKIFDQSLARAKAKTWQPTPSTAEESASVKEIKRWQNLFTALVSILLLGLAGLLYQRINGSEPPRMPPPFTHAFEVAAGEEYHFSLSDFYEQKDPAELLLTDTSRVLHVSFADGQTIDTDSLFGTYQIDSLGNFSLQVVDSLGIFKKSITVVAHYHVGNDTTYFEPYATRSEDIKIVVDSVDTVSSEPDTLALLPLPYPKNLNNLFPEPTPEWILFFNKYYLLIKFGLIFLMLALLGVWQRWYAARQQQIIVDIQSKTDPPLLWNIHIPNITQLAQDENYFKVLNQMRQRTNDDHYVLNIPKTVQKTIERAGIVDFQYEYKTRPPEYLLLIDRQSSKNHRAHLYDYLFQSFKENEVYVERFFYEGDIRLCWNETYPNGIKLQDMQSLYRDRRLIIVGTGYQLLSPVSGQLMKWTQLFETWSNKAILSPQPSKGWGGRESELAKKFILLPASIPSLTTMVDKMEAVDPDEIKTKITEDFNEPLQFKGDLIQTLHYYFSKKKNGKVVDDRMVKWIAACAIYPTLHWDLTMYLGKELSTEENNLMTVKNVMALTRLPWFIEGKIPEQARLELLEYLPEETERQLRESLQRLFNTLPMPPENSVAYADARMHVALNDYLLEKDPNLKKEIQNNLRAGTEVDVTTLKYLEGERSPKDFVVDPTDTTLANGAKGIKAKSVNYSATTRANPNVLIGLKAKMKSSFDDLEASGFADPAIDYTIFAQYSNTHYMPIWMQALDAPAKA
ncbi:MAG: hypothetical protein AAF573_21670, partial [Bacteroidota bacterium]